ncbi:MAG: glucokinase [Chitinophagaceae bacterium]|nr:glucokinase [Chitinophagaceae bacterium]
MAITDFSKDLAIGIDIGGTNTKFGIVDHRGNIIEQGDMSTRDHATPEVFVDELYKCLEPIITRVGKENIKGIGIGAPNGNFYKGTIEYAPNLEWDGIIYLTDLVTERFKLPSSLTNDANAAAVGEAMYGAARGIMDFIMITLGTGVGSGIIANGQLIYGHDGFAGELGHTIIIPDGRMHWGTNMKGSLEAYCSATGVRLTALEIMKLNPEKKSMMADVPADQLDSRIVYECAIKGDELAIEVYRFTGEILGKALANFVMFSSPEAIILFGGLCKAGKLLLDPTRKHMEENLLPIFQDKVKLIFSELKESDAAILGASALVWEMK